MIVVCPLNKLDAVAQDYAPSHVISLLGGQMEMPDLGQMDSVRHLKLSFNDISTPREGYVLPGSSDIETLIDFFHDWQRERPMVIHCWAGISRSTAACYIAHCVLTPNRDELELARQLRAASPPATPNPRMVQLADETLGRAGRMSDAIASIGRGAEAWEGNVFSVAVAKE
ncbi:MAG: tyrosine phosphatase family protein [Hyphomicrobiales bacterium]